MSEGVKTHEEKAAEARRGASARGAGGPRPMRHGLPAEKSKDFGPVGRGCSARLRPERVRPRRRARLAVASVALTRGPKILGHATT